jgi:UrcA family protein
MNASLRKILAATTLVAAAIPATAAPVEAGQSVAVHFGDLDLTTDAGVSRLNRRINNAARQACGTADIRDLRAMSMINNCRDIALGNASKEVELAVAAAKRGERYASNTASISVHSR